MTTNSPFSLKTQKKWTAWLFRILVGVLLFTGLGQMPIFKRYYIADIPGMGWSADYYLTHRLHYTLAIVLLFWIFRDLADYFVNKRGQYKLTTGGKIKATLWGGILFTGFLRVLKNMPATYFDPVVVMLIDWIHLALPFMLGIVVLGLKISGKNRYLTTNR